MISFNSNSSLFRISFNFVNTCYFFVICSFSPKKHYYKENLRDGTNLSTMTKHPVPNVVSPRRFHCSLVHLSGLCAEILRRGGANLGYIEGGGTAVIQRRGEHWNNRKTFTSK